MNPIRKIGWRFATVFIFLFKCLVEFYAQTNCKNNFNECVSRSSRDSEQLVRRFEVWSG